MTDLKYESAEMLDLPTRVVSSLEDLLKIEFGSTLAFVSL